MTPRQLVERYGTAQSAALALAVSRRTIYNWLRAGKIPPRMLPYVAQKLNDK